MKKIWIVSLLGASLLVPPAYAEYYRYKDVHGNVIYTDDLSKVPKSQRAQAKMYEESVTEPPAEEVDKEKSPAATTESATDELSDLDEEAQRLLAIKEQLDQEYQVLTKESAKIQAEQKEAVTPDQIKESNKKVVSYNARFKSFQEKQSAYETDVKAYNERLKVEDTSKSSQSE